MIWVKGFVIIFALMFLMFLWLSSINLTKPYYNHTYNVWEEDKGARQLSNIAILLMLAIMFFLGYFAG